jgi:hypothetical protein
MRGFDPLSNTILQILKNLDKKLILIMAITQFLLIVFPLAGF